MTESEQKDNIFLLQQGDEKSWRELIDRLSPKLSALFRNALSSDMQRIRVLSSDVFTRHIRGLVLSGETVR
jgi:hypothetical protein